MRVFQAATINRKQAMKIADVRDGRCSHAVRLTVAVGSAWLAVLMLSWVSLPGATTAWAQSSDADSTAAAAPEPAVTGAADVLDDNKDAVVAEDRAEPGAGGDEVLHRNIFSRALHGGLVVFTVLVSLLVMSFLSWALLVYKVLAMRMARQASARFMARFWEHASLNDLYEKIPQFEASPLKSVFLAGYAELTKCDMSPGVESSSASDIKQLMLLQVSLDSIGRSMHKARRRCRQHLERGLLWLALCASAAPFIGLLGTVWGIMNSFEDIAATGSSSLAVVAPGVSEALIATAFGLIAAIPAVVGYNVSQHHIKGVLSYIDEFKGEFLNIVERFIFDKLHTSAGDAGSGA